MWRKDRDDDELWTWPFSCRKKNENTLKRKERYTDVHALVKINRLTVLKLIGFDYSYRRLIWDWCSPFSFTWGQPGTMERVKEKKETAQKKLSNSLIVRFQFRCWVGRETLQLHMTKPVSIATFCYCRFTLPPFVIVVHFVVFSLFAAVFWFRMSIFT